MNLQKNLLTITLGSIIGTGSVQALNLPETYVMDYEGLFTFIDPDGGTVMNTSYPYYGDPTWGYGYRTQISGTFTINRFTGIGDATINPFEFMNGGPVVFTDFEFKAANSDYLLLGNMTFNWGGNVVPTQIVLDAAGLLADLTADTQIGDTIDAISCAASNACPLPASDDLNLPKAQYPIGPAPVATSSFNTAGQTGYTTTLAQLSLGTDDGIGGSPMDNGPFSGFNVNFDFTSLSVTAIYPTPIPASIWLFGSGLLGLLSFRRHRKNA